MEGAVGDLFSTKADGDDILPRFRCGVVDIESAIMVLDHVYIKLASVGCGYLAGHFSLSCSFSIYGDDRFFSDLDGGSKAGSCWPREELLWASQELTVIFIRTKSLHEI